MWIYLHKVDYILGIEPQEESNDEVSNTSSFVDSVEPPLSERSQSEDAQIRPIQVNASADGASEAASEEGTSSRANSEGSSLLIQA